MTTQELYNAIICKPDLHSHPALHDNILVWHLYKNAYVLAFCDNGDTTIDIVGNSALTGSIMHWHPSEEDLIAELYTLGKAGNILILKKALLGTSIFYAGPAQNFPLSDKTPVHFGNKKWDGGRLIYFDQK